VAVAPHALSEHSGKEPIDGHAPAGHSPFGFGGLAAAIGSRLSRIRGLVDMNALGLGKSGEPSRTGAAYYLQDRFES